MSSVKNYIQAPRGVERSSRKLAMLTSRLLFWSSGNVSIVLCNDYSEYSTYLGNRLALECVQT